MKKILFVTYGGGHVEIVISLYKELKKKYDVNVIALTNSKSRLSDENIPYDNLTTMLDNNTKLDVLNLGYELYKNSNFENSLSVEDSAEYLGFIYYDMFKNNGLNYTIEQFKIHGRKICDSELLTNNILKEYNPDVLITTTNVRVEKEFTKVANSLYIPTIRIIGLFGDTIFDTEAKYNFVINDEVKNTLITNGIKEKIIVTGQPFFNTVINQNTKNSKTFDISYFTQKIKYIDDYMNDFIEFATQNKNLKFAIKFHPSHQDDRKIGIINKHNNITIWNDTSIELIKNSNLTLTHYSTCAVEAALLNVPVYLWKYYFDEFPLMLDKYNIGKTIGEIYEINLNHQNNDKGNKLINDNNSAISNCCFEINKILG